MIHGLDTGFLVAAEVTEHGEHTSAWDTLARLLSAGDLIAIAPQVLAACIHIVTDPRRFRQPLDPNATATRQLADETPTAPESLAEGFDAILATRLYERAAKCISEAIKTLWVARKPRCGDHAHRPWQQDSPITSGACEKS